MNSYCLSGLIKWAQNSDSETHVKRLNPTSITEIRQKPRKYLYIHIHTHTHTYTYTYTRIYIYIYIHLQVFFAEFQGGCDILLECSFNTGRWFCSEAENLSFAFGQLWVSRPLMEAKVIMRPPPTPPRPALISDNTTCSPCARNLEHHKFTSFLYFTTSTLFTKKSQLRRN